MDDLLPFVEQPVTPQSACEETTEPQKMHYIPLFPRTTHLNELWPAILTKAILKIAALEYVCYHVCVCKYVDAPFSMHVVIVAAVKIVSMEMQV